MRIRDFKYYIREALRNVFSNGWMSIASVFTVLASLLVFGMFLVMIINLNFIAHQFEGDYEIILVVDENYTNEQIAELGERIKSTEYIKNVELDSSEKRLEKLKKEFGENSYLLDGYDKDNPLRDWYRVTLSDLTKSDTVTENLRNTEGIVKIIRNQETIDKLVSTTDYFRHLSLWIMVALAIISIFIISNTIKLTVFSRAKEINIMKFVGATDWFIRWPFIIEGIIIGLLGSVISLLIVCYGYDSLASLMSALGINFITFKPISEMMPYLIPAFLVLGLGLGGLGSLISVRKYLKV